MLVSDDNALLYSTGLGTNIEILQNIYKARMSYTRFCTPILYPILYRTKTA